MTTAREREELLMKKKVILERVLAKLKELILINSDKGPFTYMMSTLKGVTLEGHIGWEVVWIFHCTSVVVLSTLVIVYKGQHSV